MGKGSKRIKKGKIPKINSSINPPDKQPKMGRYLRSYRQDKPIWKISKIDADSRWGLPTLFSKRQCETIFKHLQGRETMTWEEIETQQGGRTRGTNNHYVEISKLCTEAQNRLQQLNINDIDNLFSLRVNARIRIWGIREINILQILWFDLEHEICPSFKNNT